jgi:hypothetical protein
MEPQLLVLDAFAPHKKSIKKQEEEVGDLIDEFKRLNTTISVIPRGCTSYIQPLDVSVNKIIKDLIRQCEEDHIDVNPELYDEGKITAGDRRILITHWVAKAWRILHEQHKETIIQTFRNIGISLNLDGTKDLELKIRDVPNIEVGDYALVEDNITTTPLSTDIDFQNAIAPFAMELRSQPYTTSARKDLYYIAVEVAKGIEEDDEDTEDEDEDEDEDDKEDDKEDDDMDDDETRDSGDDFDPELEEENADDINMTG